MITRIRILKRCFLFDILQEKGLTQNILLVKRVILGTYLLLKNIIWSHYNAGILGTTIYHILIVHEITI
jgi:hypothetical protein